MDKVSAMGEFPLACRPAGEAEGRRQRAAGWGLLSTSVLAAGVPHCHLSDFTHVLA